MSGADCRNSCAGLSQVLGISMSLALFRYVWRHPLNAGNHLSPVQALKQWQSDKPELFVKKVYKQTGPDS